ncbi:hypothetical protein B484DRAFT_455169 [Ochromonadaceae sp. CCMP2298]|nr:hypothetical protein B484DRAFT_455169 [Ochromonadaceae sp. CCMP2298]
MLQRLLYPTLKRASPSVLPFRAGAVGSVKGYHKSSAMQNDLIYGGMAIAGTAVVAQYALQMYKSMPTKPAESPESPTKRERKTEATPGAGAAAGAAPGAAGAAGAKGESMFAGFETWFARNFYDGGFEEKMTKREAALILGVRESATADRIKDAHRRIMQKNHPDKGGSAYLTTKVNEAKEMLIKGK